MPAMLAKGRRGIVGFLLERGARIHIFWPAMTGRFEDMKSFLAF